MFIIIIPPAARDLVQNLGKILLNLVLQNIIPDFILQDLLLKSSEECFRG
jgi:hypothetical protein